MKIILNKKSSLIIAIIIIIVICTQSVNSFAATKIYTSKLSKGDYMQFTGKSWSVYKTKEKARGVEKGSNNSGYIFLKNGETFKILEKDGNILKIKDNAYIYYGSTASKYFKKIEKKEDDSVQDPNNDGNLLKDSEPKESDDSKKADDNNNNKPKAYKEGSYNSNRYKEFKKNKESWSKNAKIVYSALIKAGSTPTGACAMLGNITAESRLNPTLKNSSNHYGIVQWGGSRLKNLKKRKNYKTVEVQTKFMIDELKNSYSSTWKKMIKAEEKDLINTTIYIREKYEVCGPGSQPYRNEFAIDWYNYFTYNDKKEEVKNPDNKIIKDGYIVVSNSLDNILKKVGEQKPGECLIYSEKYSKKILNNNSAKYTILGSNDKKEILKVVASEINQGRPVIARVETSSKKKINGKEMCSRHFITIVRNKNRCKIR